MVFSLDAQTRADILPALRPRDLRAVGASWPVRRHDHQRPPEPPWATWLFLGGRGAGKTRAGAEWIAAEAELGGRFALVGPTLHDVREVMIEGASGLLAIAAPGRRPRYEVSRRRLVWPNGAIAEAFSAEDPDSLRGPQFAAAWADEFCAWRAPEATLANLRLCLRLGAAPKLVVTTTPKPLPALRRLMAQAGVAVSRAATALNAAHLAPDFVAQLETLYGGTRLAAQELEGLVVEEEGRPLWRAEDLARCRGAAPVAYDRVVVAVDPPASARGDACGIVAVGRRGERGYVLADRTASGLSPGGWAGRVAETVAEFSADAVIAEANQGGDMVRATLAAAGCPVPIKLVHAVRGKRDRAAPAAALYEQGRVTHCGAFPALEEELMALGAAELTKSPDRADALVWALTELLARPALGPRLSFL